MKTLSSYLSIIPATCTGFSVSRCLYWACLDVLPNSSPASATYTLKIISWTSALPLRGPTWCEQWLVSGWKLWGYTVGNQKKKEAFPCNVQIFRKIYKLSRKIWRPTKTSNFKHKIFHKNSKYLFIDSSKPIYKINKNFYTLFTNSTKKFLSKYNISILISNQIYKFNTH